jgi:phosphomevalonate kinase
LITSLVSALLLHFSAIPPSSFTDHNSEGRRLAHNLAQYVHCFAQGKVGSGFDVSAAVFGSHLYTRFNPAVLHGLMNDDAVSPPYFVYDACLDSLPIDSVATSPPVLLPSNTAWDYRVQPFKLPPFTRIMLADVDAGSNTPSLVGLVLKWRKEKPTEGCFTPLPETDIVADKHHAF